MAGDDRGEYKPRRARPDDGAPEASAPEPSAPTTPEQAGNSEQADNSEQAGNSEQAHDESLVDTGNHSALSNGQTQNSQTQNSQTRNSQAQNDWAENVWAELHRSREHTEVRPAPTHLLTTQQRIAVAQRAERLAELQQLRDRTTSTRISRADRPDIGHRRNTAEPVPLPHRRIQGVVSAVVAIVVVAALATGYLYWSSHRSTPTAARPTQPTTAAVNTNVITDSTMFTPALADTVIKQNWTITADQPADTAGSPVPACLTDSSDKASDDMPTPTQSMIRTLSTSSNGPTALHLVEDYKSAEPAEESFALVAKALGGCNLNGSYIASARVITGLGDEAAAVLLDDPVKDSYRAVVANRTGHLVNVVDVAETKNPPNLDKIANALGRLTDQQCTLATGTCASHPRAEDGPPPVGGDEPGFLALADIPMPTSDHGTWGDLPPGPPADVVTSGCENVDFATLPATSRAARSYILVDTPQGMPTTFGLDEITLTMKSAKAAAKEAKEIGTNIKNCVDREPTAKISNVDTVAGVGADDLAITGSVALVTQKTTAKKSSTFRVGVAAAGTKLVYTFLPRTDNWDLTKSEWSGLTVRAAQRATQVR